MGIVSVHGGNSRRRVGYRPAPSREEAGMPRVVSILFTGVLVGAALVGCGSSGHPQPVPTVGSVAPPTTQGRASSAPVAVVGPSTSGFPTAYAVTCAGKPDATQIVALLRANKVLTAAATATPTLGPLCSGDWQYTAFDVMGLGPLEVVTKGDPAALQLVTAGTDICTSTVADQAPPGIRAITRC
jgi:hypothetical protein